MHRIVKRSWPIYIGFALVIIIALIDASGWHESHAWSTRITFISLGLAGPFMALAYTGDISLVTSIPWILLHSMLICSYIVYPRWYTALTTIIAVQAWYFIGKFIMGISC